MHATIVKTKDGKEYRGPMSSFQPVFNWFKLFGIDKKFSFDECESIITKGERISINSGLEGEDYDEMKRAKKYLDDGRKFKWEERDEDGTYKLYPQEKFEWEKKYEKM